jgi:transposase
LGGKDRSVDAKVLTTTNGVATGNRRSQSRSNPLVYTQGIIAAALLEALTPQKRGPKSKRNPMEEEVQKLLRQNARLTEDLRKAHIIIDVQKKVAALLGNPIPEQDPEDKS